MKRITIHVIIALAVTLSFSCRDQDKDLEDLKLWYDKPAEKWETVALKTKCSRLNLEEAAVSVEEQKEK